ncbi:TonB-dependent receptor [Mucilaginibacter sp. JRF]|uniref:SusC/RagA family TonB-linked outer membrane protein n=1 Tax=Mucilaginibacter sp. JRF TaxID=2780088 RepID=UPI001880BCCE|nr:TonB-dependent receptor [Mucilaginibacter sp. JRF]MBE9585908.1 TonB-dependent receptor [Mucilaginibacter sp. JRF]
MIKIFTKCKLRPQLRRVNSLALCVSICLAAQTLGTGAVWAAPNALNKGATFKPVEITGTVTDESGVTMAGVNVSVKGTKTGTTTNADGAYKISVEPGATLVYSMLGFETQEVVVSSQKVVDVKLLQTNKQLSEVLVIGYGSKNKSTFTGSAVTLNAEDLNKASLSMANMLQGRAAGVQVTQNNGTPGASLSIRVRGTNSLNANSEPLYVIDGFPVSDQVGFTLNPDDVASISILKDAASTAIYGARGANGVVLVTTKSGNKHKSNLSVHSYGGMQTVINRFDLMNGYQNALRINDIATQQGNTPPYTATRLDSLQQGILGTDWQDQLFRTGYVQNHNLSFEGGGPKTNVFTSFDFMKQDGIIIKSGYKRIGGRVNVNHAVNDKFTMSARVFGNYGTQNDLPLAPSTINGFLKQVIKANPASTFDSGLSAQRDAQNPLHFLAAEDRENSTYRTQAYYSLKYEPIKGLTLQTDLGADMNRTEILYFSPSTVTTSAATNGRGSITNIDERDLIINPTAKYAFKKDEHNFNLLAGYNAQDYTYKESGINATNFSSDELGYDNIGTAQQFTGYSSKTKIKRRSWFGRIDYDYQNKYIFSGTYRIDGSSVFGSNSKLGYFPSAAVAWNFTEEEFLKGKNFLSTGKLRASYGITGNDRIPTGISLATFSSDNSTKYTFDGVSTISGIAINRLSNPDLKWEETKAIDVGMNLGFFNNRILLELDYYSKTTSDLLLDRSIAPSTGFQSRFGNSGEVTNKGFEAFLQTTNLRGKGFRWNTTFSYSYNKNKVTSLGSNNSDIYVGSFKPDGAANFESPFIIRVGEPVGSIYGYVYDGIIQENDPVLTSTHPNAEAGDPKFKDLNGDGIVNAEDRTILGTGVPKAIIGFTNNIVYKGFELDIVLQGQTGGKLVNVQKADLLNPISNGNGLAEIATNTWSPTNTSGTIPAKGFYGNAHGGWVNSRFVESSDYLRIKNVTLGYTVPERISKRFGMSTLHFYVNAQNLFTWSGYSGLDPEIGNLVDNSQQNRNVARGMDFNAYPLSKMYLLGAKITF